MNDFKRVLQFTGNYTKIFVRGELVADGARDPRTRHAHIPIDLAGKRVIDLGCNCGGTLYAVHDQILHGYGYEINQQAVDNANLVKQKHAVDNLTFTQANLETDTIEWPEYDVLFCFSIARWVRNWREVLEGLNPNIMVFEAHGKPQHLEEQLAWLHANFESVQHLNTARENKVRSLYLCER